MYPSLSGCRLSRDAALPCQPLFPGNFRNILGRFARSTERWSCVFCLVLPSSVADCLHEFQLELLLFVPVGRLRSGIQRDLQRGLRKRV